MLWLTKTITNIWKISNGVYELWCSRTFHRRRELVTHNSGGGALFDFFQASLLLPFHLALPVLLQQIGVCSANRSAATEESREPFFLCRFDARAQLSPLELRQACAVACL